MNGTKLVVNASSLLLATARARCVFVHVAVGVRLPSPRALRRNAYIYQGKFVRGTAQKDDAVLSVLFVSVLDPRVSHTVDVLSPFIPVLCHSG